MQVCSSTTVDMISHATPISAARTCRRSESIALSWRRYGPHVEGISSVRLSHGEAVDGAQVYDPRTPRRAQKEGRAQSQKARPQAESYVAFRPLRNGRLVAAGNPPGPEQVFVGQAASDDAADCHAEAVGVVHV